MKTRLSLSGRFALFAGIAMLAAAATAAWASSLGWPPVSVFLSGLLVGAPLAAWMVSRAFRPVRNTLRTLTDGVRSFHENDFGLRIADGHGDELGELVSLYNRLGDALRRERNEIYQRELLLDTVLQGAPMAIVLVNELQRVVYANAAARSLFGQSRRLAGRAFGELVEGSPPEIRRPLAAEEDAIVAGAQSGADGEGDTFRVLNRRFYLNTQQHRLIVVERMTAELKRQEVDVWKKVIRVMSHELNNSLAPVRSLVHSARLLAERPDRGRVIEVLGSVEDRVRHLCDFLEGYARFARLPLPRREAVSWRSFLGTVQAFFPFRLETSVGPEEGYFDPAQMQQVLINLLKNAAESGSPPAEIAVSLERSREGSWLVHVLDRGREMDEETMKKALLPFYSSKQSGSGLGLPLCTEILTAHGGTLRLQRRPGGGMSVTCVLPEAASEAS
ncbi:MAG TPA: ATP-binding protein [Thermoanaerobaculia bacterium]|nr:ATP-binding protein [Thermoanaerobaculia bacterium]